MTGGWRGTRRDAGRQSPSHRPGDAKRKMATLLGGMATCHLVLLLLFKLYFFHYA